jgi:uncharacterized protein (TIGR02452 family)
MARAPSKEDMRANRRSIFQLNERSYDTKTTPMSFPVRIQDLTNGPFCSGSGLVSKIEFLQMNTNEAIRYYLSKGISGDKICALNFANSIYVGGGVTKGSIAQEETLCLTSPMLYHSLATVGSHKTNSGSLKYNGYYPWNQRIIISKNIEFIRDSELDESEKYTASIISAAAPNNKGKTTPLNAYEMREIEIVIRNILNLAGCVNDFEVLILGAWGCGAFAPQAPASTVDNTQLYVNTIANIFNQVLQTSKTNLKTICFAIPQKSQFETLDKFDIFIQHILGTKTEKAVAPSAAAAAPVSRLAVAPSSAAAQTKIDVLTDAIKEIIKNAIISKIIKKQ